MIEPNKYELNKSIDSEKLINSGFIKRGDIYHKKKFLNSFIYEEIEIDLKEMRMVYFVKNKNFNNYYAPFYHPEDVNNSESVQSIIQTFNNYMNELCNQKILWKPHYKRIKKKKLYPSKAEIPKG